MLRFHLVAQCILLFLGCCSINLAYASLESTKNNLLQTYRDEIKQSENNASQTVLDALNTHTDTDNSSQKNQSISSKPSVATPTPRLNTDKAFTPLDDKSASTSSKSNNKNPWLQPNPWAKQPPNIWEKNAKVNPYSNAPIPGPTSSTHSTVPTPPNIFAPRRSTLNTNQTQSNANL